jgi:membrane associated rhomboid family serine protease
VLFALMFANGAVLVGEYINGNNQALFLPHGFVPAHPSVATSFTSMFLQAGFWHFAGNMFFFWMFGNRVESLFGRSLFAALPFERVWRIGLLLCPQPALGVSVCGASGAISGIAGCFLVRFPARGLT